MINKRFEQFQSGPFFLTGQWDEPTDSNRELPLPSVIFTHGFTGNRFESRRMFCRVSQRLAASGIRTFRFDHRGCGDSEGDFIDFNADSIQEDLDRALERFLANPGVDPARTAVVGYSLGGLAASYLLSRRPEWVTGILWAPVAQPDIIRDRLESYPDFHNYRTKGHFDYMGFRVSADYFDNIGKLNPVSWAASFKKPITILQGEEDPIVKPEQAHRYLAARSNPQDQLILYKDGDHAFGSADNIDNVVQTTSQILIDQLKP